MRNLQIFVFLLAWFAAADSCPGVLHAQSNQPFKSPALDSNCYFPQIGVPAEIDTIVGNHSNEELGSLVHNLGSNANGNPGNVLLGTGPAFTSGGPSEVFSIAPTGTNFNLHDLKAKAQQFLPDVINLRFGHFHNRANVDIFDALNWIIYWADENGNYDSTRHTTLKSNVIGDEIEGILGDGGMGFTPYISHLSNDTIDDIVLGYGTNNFDITTDSLILILFNGGSSLASKSIAYEDTSANYGRVDPSHSYHSCVEGDFRGIGREDLVMSDQQRTLFFFRNDPPFRLSALANALRFDTLWTRTANVAWGDSNNYWPDPFCSLVMHALPKKPGDNSYDWVVSVPTSNDSDLGIFIFRGGPYFGSHRITIDSAAFVILHPQVAFEPNWPGQFFDVGDMTGTGNRVFYTLGGDGSYAYQNFYVTGQALDQKIDIFNFANAGAFGDTLTADGDNLEDFLMGLPNYSTDSGGIGSIWLMYGSKQIPVHLNPQFADIVNLPQKDGAGMALSPNPAQTWSVATIIWPQAENVEYKFYNLLGNVVQSGNLLLLGGPEQQRLYFPNLISGLYVLEIRGESQSARTKLVVAR